VGYWLSGLLPSPLVDESPFFQIRRCVFFDHP
jgi:hypothetical protein